MFSINVTEYLNSFRPPYVILRGLTNGGNQCFINSTLQALMACPPFVQLMKMLNFMQPRENSSTPILDAM